MPIRWFTLHQLSAIVSAESAGFPRFSQFPNGVLLGNNTTLHHIRSSFMVDVQKHIGYRHRSDSEHVAVCMVFGRHFPIERLTRFSMDSSKIGFTLAIHYPFIFMSAED